MNKTMDINRRQLIKGLGVGAAALAYLPRTVHHK